MGSYHFSIFQKYVVGMCWPTVYHPPVVDDSRSSPSATARAATNTRYPVHTARAAQPNYMLPLHATGLTRGPLQLVHPNVRPDGSLQDRTALSVIISD